MESGPLLYLASLILLTVAGGDPIACQQGSGVIGTRLGTLMLQGTGLNAILELQTGTFANASNQAVTAGNQAIAMTMNTSGKLRETGTAIVSRDVPGYEVLVDAERTLNGKKVQTIRVEVLDFETK